LKTKSDTFEYQLKIKEHHLDSFGHVNNAIYLQLFEEARWDFITSKDYGLAEIHRQKKGPVVLAVEMKFMKELKNRELITIKSFCYDYRGKIGKIEQVMVNSKGEDACSALFTFGFFDLVERKLILPTKDWLKAIGLEPLES
jgi:YbgC/YbaW family acyl-CoA thioester hydrolase